ncbi:MAG: beta-glucosidase [Aphanocapsa lilacina HA4352-LM1]|jgi:beta-glucosidase|nr:beta-glucosidase [Aphanocapsa lilacina HA4352-LM1]
MANLPRAAQLNLKEAIGQLLVPRISGFLLDHQRLYPQWELAAVRLEAAIVTHGVGGVLVYGGSLGDTFLKIQALQQQAALPLLIAADLEAGCGQHIRGATVLPVARALGAAAEADYAYHCGAITAREARSVGINWVLAPCLDVMSNPRNPVIGLRSFGEDPREVARLGVAFAAGLRDGGVLSAIKHFPGHGDVEVDSHLALPVLGRERARLEAEDWLPFRAVLAAGADSLMSAHLRVPALDPEWPATLSRRILTEIVREAWGYTGIIVTDALNMGAIASWPAPAVRALQAGVDVIMMPESVPDTVDLIVSAVRRGLLSEERLYASVERVLAAKARLAPPSAAPLAVEQRSGQALERMIAKAAVTVERDRAGLLPVPCLKPTLNILVVDRCLDGTVAADSPILERRELGPHYETHWLEAAAGEEYLAFLGGRAAAHERTLVQVLTPVRAYRGTAGVHPAAEHFLRSLAGERTILVSYTNPYLGRQFEQLSTVLNAFNNGPASHAAALERLES